MTDSELLSVYKSLHEVSVLAAIRAIYNIAYSAGAGTTLTAQSTDASVVASKPADAVVALVKTSVVKPH